MVLGWRRPGRVGHCRIPNEKPLAEARGFSFALSCLQLTRLILDEYASTWLGKPMAARSACNTAMGERPGALTAELLSASALAGAFPYPIDNVLLSGYPS